MMCICQSYDAKARCRSGREGYGFKQVQDKQHLLYACLEGDRGNVAEILLFDLIQRLQHTPHIKTWLSIPLVVSAGVCCILKK